MAVFFYGCLTSYYFLRRFYRRPTMDVILTFIPCPSTLLAPKARQREYRPVHSKISQTCPFLLLSPPPLYTLISSRQIKLTVISYGRLVSYYPLRRFHPRPTKDGVLAFIPCPSTPSAPSCIGNDSVLRRNLTSGHSTTFRPVSG